MITNEKRAARAAVALAAHQIIWLGENGPIEEGGIIDLLTDLRHYTGQNGIDWSDVLHASGENYRAEVSEEMAGRIVTKRAAEHYRAEVDEDLPAANPREPFLIRGPGKDFKITKCD